MDGKNSDTPGERMLVVAGALKGAGDRWLMHQRPEGKHHVGLWEFPGGKVEPAEIPVKALIRELREELGIAVVSGDCLPATFAEIPASGSQKAIVILLYIVAHWEGEPQALEGGAIDWFAPGDIARLDKPPLDVKLAQRLFEKAQG